MIDQDERQCARIRVYQMINDVAESPLSIHRVNNIRAHKANRREAPDEFQAVYGDGHPQ